MHRMLIGLLGNGHLLIEGVPGLAKTTAVSCLAKGINTGFQRLQFTPDLLPSDVLGVSVYDQKTQEFRFRPGPVFTDILLADEINRASPRTQSALLEAMAERQATVDGRQYELEGLFFVVATQNPVEQEGTYPLPEAQVDRFLLKVVIGYPSKAEEQQIVRANLQEGGLPKPGNVVSKEAINQARKLVRTI